MTAAAVSRVGSGGAWRWLLLIAAAAAALLALEWWRSADRAVPQPSPPPPVMTGLPRNYPEALARLDLLITDARAQAAAHDGEWLRYETLARHLAARARLTGDYGDYAAARDALDRAFAVAAPGTGPHLVRAGFEFGMHRLGAAEAQLDRIDRYVVQPLRPERSEVAAMRGDIAFYSGRYADALGHYDAADRIDPGAADFRRAIYHARTGDPDRAERFFDRSERASPLAGPQARSYLELQRGILDLDRGRWPEAMAHFRRADAIFPDHWLIEEHIAEVTALEGDPAKAAGMYRDIVRRTGHPEFMDALADIHAAQGEGEQAQSWRRRARAAWTERLAAFPEASYGHAIDHCVAAGDRRCALRLARLNAAARPHGDAHIALALALLGDGRVAEAKAVIERVLATPWRTAALHTAAAEIFIASGDATRASEQRRAALAIDPHAFDSIRLRRGR